jgi:hypothetical protein
MCVERERNIYGDTTGSELGRCRSQNYVLKLLKNPNGRPCMVQPFTYALLTLSCWWFHTLGTRWKRVEEAERADSKQVWHSGRRGVERWSLDYYSTTLDWIHPQRPETEQPKHNKEKDTRI